MPIVCAVCIQADLAQVSGGQSCTCVPTEYQGAFPKQKKDFAACIRYFDINKIRQILCRLIGDYNIFTFEADRDWEEDIRTTYKRGMQNALKTFQVLFCDLDIFRTQKAGKEFLKSNYHDDSVNAIDVFMQSCEEKLKDKISVDDGYAEYYEFNSRTKLREVIDPLMSSKSTNEQAALWPLVKQML